MANFRFVVEDVFDIPGRGGPVVTGKIASGKVCVGDEVELWPDLGQVKQVRILAIEKLGDIDPSEASSGDDDVGLELSGVEPAGIGRQSVLVSPPESHAASTV